MPLGSLSPTPDPRPKRLRQVGLVGLALAGAAAAGWWWGQQQPNRSVISSGQQQTLERRSEKLETKLAAGTANDAEQRQLLRLRLALLALLALLVHDAGLDCVVGFLKLENFGSRVGHRCVQRLDSGKHLLLRLDCRVDDWRLQLNQLGRDAGISDQ